MTNNFSKKIQNALEISPKNDHFFIILIFLKDFEKKFEFEKKKSFCYIVFYNECNYETLPIISGCCLNLVYDIVYTGKDNIPLAINNNDKTIKLINLFNQWYQLHKGNFEKFRGKFVLLNYF